MKTKTSGGSAVASGGYGCIFRPMIPCKKSDNTMDIHKTEVISKNTTDKKEYVSKLMLNRDANAEISEVMRFYKIIQNIPNNQDYFIFPNVACTPGKLTNKDKLNYDKKCTKLARNGITSKNVNQHLLDLSILQIPDGGIDLHDFIDNNSITKDIFYKINRNLILLLKNAIVRMNNLNLYHLDLKASNVLVDVNNNYKVKLIDWGMSSHIKNKNMIPNIGHRPFHFNMPYSIILMNTATITHIENVIYNSYSKTELSVSIASELIERYYNRYLSKKLGDGHLEYIKHVSTILNINGSDPYNEIFTYLGKIIVHFRKNDNTFDYTYFDVFLHNIDVWGFISIYLPFMDIDEKFEDKQLRKLKPVVRKLYTEFLYKYVVEKIPISKLIQFLETLNRQYYPIAPGTTIAYVDTLLSKTITMNLPVTPIKKRNQTRKMSTFKSKNKSRKFMN